MTVTKSRPHQSERNKEGRAWHLLAIVLVGSFMAVLDTTIVNVALPSIAKGIQAESSTLEWIVSGYALTFGLVLVPAGRIGDRIGTKPMFLIGLAIFTVGSVGCGLAQSSAQLVAARVVQGLGAGTYYPAISATIQRSFSGRDRSRAFGYLGGVVGISTALGPLLGGLIITFAGVGTGWRWVFLVNLFVGAALFPLALRFLPRGDEQQNHKLDPVGNALLAVVLLLLLVPLIEGRATGWPPWSWACLASVIPAVAVLTLWERRCFDAGSEPVFRRDLFGQRSFTAGHVVALSYFAGFTSLFFTLSIVWQDGLGHSALDAGLLMLPFALGSLVSASNSDRVSSRIGRSTILLGCSAMTLGQVLVVLVLHLTTPQPSATWLIAPLALAGLGNGLVIAPNQDFVLRSVPSREAGTAGGSLITAQRIGAAIGIAIVGTVLFGSASSEGGGGTMPQLVGSAQAALLVNVGFVLLALVASRLLPRRLDQQDDKASA
jgi:EmrB/QacA subfamily drug resistance transporter